jgi:hypothetical protein
MYYTVNAWLTNRIGYLVFYYIYPGVVVILFCRIYFPGLDVIYSFWLRVLNLCFASSIRSYGFRQTPDQPLKAVARPVAFASLRGYAYAVLQEPEDPPEFMRVGGA